MSRPSGRTSDQLRSISLEPSVALHAEGSCLAKFGNTHVFCTASLDERVPTFLRNSGRGWSPLNTVCCRDRHIAAWIVKQRVESNLVEHWKFND